jgi:phospholipid-binding lipoprotein MlaA
VSDVGRLVVNSTAGLLGVIDVATEVGLEKHNEDFGQTLGFWGIGDGPYLVLPFLGPSNLRDSIGLLVDFKTDPVTYVDPPSDRNVLWGVRFVNRRSELLETSKILETAALDPYEFLRDAYLQRRRNLVYDGSPPPEKDEDIEIKMKPRTENQPDGPFPSSADDSAPVGSVLVSGEPPTPAQQEARDQAARAVRDQTSSREPRVEAPATNSNRVVRMWLPQAN